MKIVVISDIHDNLARWEEAAKIIKTEKIKAGICCGDVTSFETLEEISKSFEKLYLALGNADFKIKNAIGLVPENVEAYERVGLTTLSGKKIAFCHYDWLARKIFEESKYDLIFYGHTHTPWEKRENKGRVLLNPGEISGQFGPASFAVFDLGKMKAELKLLK